jgi:type VI secretion system protein ImpC
LRLPYGQDGTPVRAFAFEESVAGHHERYLWGNAAFAFATRLSDSFARYRWCPNVIGPQSGGSVPGLPLHRVRSAGADETKIPTEVLISERREFELAEQGFIALAMRKGSDDACFFSASSCQRTKTFGNSSEGKQAEVNHRLGAQLPYLFVVNRLAHYLKVLQREQIGSWKERADLERELNAWLGQYVADMDNPQPAVRNVRPLRAARVAVEDAPGDPGWYRVRLSVRPHFKYLGASFTLSLVGKLDQEAR